MNVHTSFNIESRLLKLSVVILDIIMQGTMSQNLYLGHSFFLYEFENDAYKFKEMFPVF